MDADIEELKEIIERQGRQIEETHHMVRGMRRSQRMHTLFSVVWWLVITGITAYAYFMYAKPYVDQIVKVYGSIQNFEAQLPGFFQNSSAPH